MSVKKVVKFGIICVVIIFFCAYVIEESGYYEYNLSNKRNLTEEQIKQFESDVKEGKDIDIDDYVVDSTVDYSNKLTKVTTKISLGINDYLKDKIKGVFSILNRMVEE